MEKENKTRDEELKNRTIERESKRLSLGVHIKGLKEAKVYNGVKELLKMEKENKTIGIVDNLNNERVATLKEFNLSEKILVPIEGDKKITFIPVKDVKEFIRKLKEETKDTDEPKESVWEIIDRLAGKELNGNL